MRISDWSSDVCSSDLTPQVWIDHQISEEDGNLLCNWDVVVDLFPEGMVDAMVSAYERLLTGLAAGDGWDCHVGAALPAASRAEFAPEIGRASCRERVCQYV